MAELLVKAIDGTNPDPAGDALCYKSGDIVVVAADGHLWGRRECLPDFLVVRIPGVSVEEAGQYLAPVYLAPAVEPVMVVRRRFRLNYLAAIAATLGPDGVAIITAADWLVPEISESYIEEKI